MTTQPAQLSQLESVFKNVVTSLLALGAVTLFIMLLSGGFKYLTSGGDPKATEGAQKTLTYAIFGFVLLAGSYILLKIISDLTGANVTNFVIKK